MPSSYAIGERFQDFIPEQVESGRYSSGPTIPAEEVFDRLTSKYREMLKP